MALVPKLEAPTSSTPKPDEWGHRCWYVLEMTADAVPRLETRSHKEEYLQWWYCWRFLLPCSECRQDFKDYWISPQGEHTLKHAITIGSTDLVKAWIHKYKEHVMEKSRQRVTHAASQTPGVSVRSQYARMVPSRTTAPMATATPSRVPQQVLRQRRKQRGVCTSCGGGK